MGSYTNFLKSKSQFSNDSGFKSLYIPDFLFDFQKYLVDWSVKKGRNAIFADCGMGKTIMQLVWAENIIRKTNKNILIMTPLAVSHQTLREAEKFGIECKRSDNGNISSKITITNYERVHYFNTNDFIGVVCDESSILKNFNGTRKRIITEFLRTRPYRLLGTATAAPNDYIELGTTSEALGELGYMDMLNRFFKNDQSTSGTKRQWSVNGGSAPKWRFKKHAQSSFWQWVSSWAKALRNPSDLGFNDTDFKLPELLEKQTIIDNQKPLPGELFVRPAFGLKEQREELKITLQERCEKAAEQVDNTHPVILWCNLNAEGDLLEKLIPDATQVSGSDSDEKKEKKLLGFSTGENRILITKPKIGGFGMNWQHCHKVSFFPTHSFEQYYQAVRRCWRFGQKSNVVVNIITTKGNLNVLNNLKRKAKAADNMFTQLISFMNNPIKLNIEKYNKKMEVPSWL